MKRVLWSDAAIAELGEADDHHRPLDRVYADRLADSVFAATRFLASNPAAGMEVSGRRRKWRVRGTPYLILYRPADTSVRILHVVHAARDWTRFL